MILTLPTAALRPLKGCLNNALMIHFINAPKIPLLQNKGIAANHSVSKDTDYSL